MLNTKYDSLLLSLPFYATHSYTLPFVGDDYDSPKHKKLLLIGESHYMPAGSTVHHDGRSGTAERRCSRKMSGTGAIRAEHARARVVVSEKRLTVV